MSSLIGIRRSSAPRIWRWLAALALVLPAPVAQAADAPLNVIDLGPESNGFYLSVNDTGEAAGVAFSGQTQSAVRWQNGVVTTLGDGASRGTAIDNAGDVFGYEQITDDSGTFRYPARWDAATNQVTIDRSHPGGEGGGYTGASPNGTAVGAWYAPSGEVDAFVVPPGGAPVDVAAHLAASVNDLGHLAGYASYYNGTSVVTTNVRAGWGSHLANHMINGLDDIAGNLTSGSAAAVVRHADGSEAPLAELPNAAAGDTQALAINNAGVVVGAGGSAGALIWQPGGTSVATLDSMLPPGSPWHLRIAYDITDNGYILGSGTVTGSSEPHTFMISGRPASVISGTLSDRSHKPLEYAKVNVTGVADDGTAVSKTVTSDAAGAYSLTTTPGTYTVTPAGEPVHQNGGTWLASPCPGTATATTGACALGAVPAGGKPVASFVYTQCSAEARHPNGKPPTGCPIVFVPGFLGSRIVCSTGEMWPGLPLPDWSEMALLPDGRTNSGKPGSCGASAGPVPGQSGIVQYVAGLLDIYGGALKFLNSIAPGRVYAYPYDWRRSVYDAVDGLDREIDTARTDTGANRVVIMAHSMGGLVTRAYIDGTAHADKVTRVVTLGTPYWGAPKSHFALLGGYTDTNETSVGLFSLDNVTAAPHLEALARNAAGLYWLYPSAALGPWLSVSDLSNGKLGPGGVDQWVRSLGGNPALLDAALAGHAALDALKTNDIDYAVVVGAGTATVTSMAFDSTGNEHGGVGFWATIRYGSGDGTVPLTSATMGVSAGAKAIASTHYVCGVAHVPLPNDAATQARIKGYLLEGEPIPGPENNCPFTGTEVTGSRIPPQRLSVRAASGTMSIDQARKAGLISMNEINNQDFIVLDDRHPVTLTIDAKKLALQVTRLGVTGAAAKRHSYGPVSGSLTVGATGTLTSRGRTLKPIKPSKRAPRTRAHVSRKGSKFRVVLRARSKNGVSTTFYRFGRARAKGYAKPLTVTRKRLRTLRFASIDVFGHQEKPRRAKLRKR